MQQTSNMPGMRQSQTLLTTLPSTALQPRSFAAAAKTWGMLAMRACHLLFSIAHPKHCSAGESSLSHRRVGTGRARQKADTLVTPLAGGEHFQGQQLRYWTQLPAAAHAKSAGT